MYIYIYSHTQACCFAHMHICIHTHVYIYTYIHIYTHTCAVKKMDEHSIAYTCLAPALAANMLLTEPKKSKKKWGKKRKQWLAPALTANILSTSKYKKKKCGNRLSH